MSKRFSKSPDEVGKRVIALIEKYHPELHANSVKVDCISVASTDPDDPTPLKLNGYPCAAVIKVISSKDRTMGRGDAEIVIDELSYLSMLDREKDALLDHELTHLEVKKNKFGRTKMDEHNRPKLGMRLHDRQYGWFDSVAKRHGSASMECKQALKLYIAGSQTYFEFDLKTEIGKGAKATVKLLPERK